MINLFVTLLIAIVDLLILVSAMAICILIQTVKLADILDNVPSMILHNPEFGFRYLDEKLETLRVLTKANKYLFKVTQDYLLRLKGAANV